MKVLIVDDEVIIASSLRLALRSRGLEVVGTATTGRAGIRLARELRPDVVLMDINLVGDLDGIEAADEIRRDPGAGIVFMTGYSDKSIHDRARALAPLGVLEKPVELRNLLPLLEGSRIAPGGDPR